MDCATDRLDSGGLRGVSGDLVQTDVVPRCRAMAVCGKQPDRQRLEALLNALTSGLDQNLLEIRVACYGLAVELNVQKEPSMFHCAAVCLSHIAS